jgi:hypothetical protein
VFNVQYAGTVGLYINKIVLGNDQVLIEVGYLCLTRALFKSLVAIHLGPDRVRRGLGRSRIRTCDCHCCRRGRNIKGCRGEGDIARRREKGEENVKETARKGKYKAKLKLRG